MCPYHHGELAGECRKYRYFVTDAQNIFTGPLRSRIFYTYGDPLNVSKRISGFFLVVRNRIHPNLSIHSMLCTYMRVIAFTHVQDSMRCSPYDIRLLEPLYKRTVVSNPNEIVISYDRKAEIIIFFFPTF